MIYLGIYLAYCIIVFICTWILYLAAGCTYWAEVHNDLIPDYKVKVLRWFASKASMLLNWTVMIFLFPKRQYFSGTLLLHVQESSGWRNRISKYMAKAWLDPFDPTGKHI